MVMMAFWGVWASAEVAKSAVVVKIVRSMVAIGPVCANVVIALLFIAGVILASVRLGSAIRAVCTVCVDA